jgi:hypothetical protein
VSLDNAFDLIDANQRCSRTALGGVSLDNAFDLIEGHPEKGDAGEVPQG